MGHFFSDFKYKVAKIFNKRFNFGIKLPKKKISKNKIFAHIRSILTYHSIVVVRVREKL